MSALDPTPSRTAASLARGVSATGWYIASTVVFMMGGAFFMWGVAILLARGGWKVPGVFAGFTAGSVMVLVSTVVLLARYRRDGDLDSRDRVPGLRRFLSWPVLLGVVGSVVAGVVAGSSLFAASVIATILCLLRWDGGLRWRGVVLVEVMLVLLWFVERSGIGAPAVPEIALPLAGFAVGLPAITALSLWSWDVVLELDRARGTEARLAAVQERLRLASELHDLQGHHLQVIALQLELAERMLERDPDAAAHQIALARASVDEARTGTRELAGRYRGVPLPDELANAADLLRAAGISVTLDVAMDAAAAPADLLGPVIRECTTNILKHGGGDWARLGLVRDGAAWRFSAANDAGAPSALGDGAGLSGIAHRIGVVGGSVRSGIVDGAFEVTVTVPIHEEGGAR